VKARRMPGCLRPEKFFFATLFALAAIEAPRHKPDHQDVRSTPESLITVSPRSPTGGFRSRPVKVQSRPALPGSRRMKTERIQVWVEEKRILQAQSGDRVDIAYLRERVSEVLIAVIAVGPDQRTRA
jgi:hypothetical protein